VCMCTLKFGAAYVQGLQGASGNARKIMVRGCAHLNLALHGAELVMHEK
jgi:hypothetical protein